MMCSLLSSFVKSGVLTRLVIPSLVLHEVFDVPSVL